MSFKLSRRRGAARGWPRRGWAFRGRRSGSGAAVALLVALMAAGGCSRSDLPIGSGQYVGPLDDDDGGGGAGTGGTEVPVAPCDTLALEPIRATIDQHPLFDDASHFWPQLVELGNQQNLLFLMRSPAALPVLQRLAFDAWSPWSSEPFGPVTTHLILPSLDSLVSARGGHDGRAAVFGRLTGTGQPMNLMWLTPGDDKTSGVGLAGSGRRPLALAHRGQQYLAAYEDGIIPPHIMNLSVRHLDKDEWQNVTGVTCSEQPHQLSLTVDDGDFVFAFLDSGSAGCAAPEPPRVTIGYLDGSKVVREDPLDRPLSFFAMTPRPGPGSWLVGVDADTGEVLVRIVRRGEEDGPLLGTAVFVPPEAQPAVARWAEAMLLGWVETDGVEPVLQLRGLVDDSVVLDMAVSLAQDGQPPTESREVALMASPAGTELVMSYIQTGATDDVPARVQLMRLDCMP